MENARQKKQTQNGQSTQTGFNFSLRFLEKKKQALKEDHEKRRRLEEEKQQERKAAMKKNTNDRQNASFSNSKNYGSHVQNNHFSFNQQKTPQPIQQQKKVGAEQILSNGTVLRIIQRTLTKDQFRVLCSYDGQLVELIASKQQIIKNNIIPLLDYYENVLNLR